MSNIFAQFEHVNADKGYRFGDDSVIETRFETKGELYKYCLSEYGRCVSKIYVDPDGAKPIGWIFIKREKYTDCDETYLQETWVTVHIATPKKSIEYFYA